MLQIFKFRIKSVLMKLHVFVHALRPLTMFVKFVFIFNFKCHLLLPRLPELGKLGKAVVRHRISLE